MDIDHSCNDCRLEYIKGDSFAYPCEKCNDKLRTREQALLDGGDSDVSASGSFGSDDTFVPVSRCSNKSYKLKVKPGRLTRNNSKLSEYQCVLCKKVFTKKYLLDKHVKSHVNCDPSDVQIKFEVSDLDIEGPLQCDMDTTNEKIKKTFHCDVCNKNFSLKDSYFRHMRIHSGERPFTCHICGKSFRDSGGLARHLKDVHAGIKNFPCDICGRSFASKATREDHRRIHTGERPYVCDSCGKTFKSKASLYLHSKIHTDTFPHPCTHCSKHFRRRQEFLAHVTTHTGEKPYPCETCGKSFRVKGELLRHKLIHSEHKPYVCSLCGLSFRQKRYLRNHEKSRHDSRNVDTATHITLTTLH